MGLTEKDSGRHPDLQREFLPAALAVQQTPPSPLARRLSWILLLVFTIAVLWSVLGQVDIVVSAPGRIVPSGQVKLVQAPDAGVVSAIHVEEGGRVEAGQPLFSLDQTFTDADTMRVSHQLRDIALQAQWRQALDRWLADGGDEIAPLQVSGTYDRDATRRARKLYAQHQAEIAATLRGMALQLAANRAQRSGLEGEENKIRATLAVQVERVGVYAALLERQLGARVQYLQLLQEQTELEQSLPVLDARQRQLDESAAAIRAQINAVIGEQRKLNLLELARLDSERATLREEEKKARQRQQRQVLTSPVTGTAHELTLHTVGAIVTAAQELVTIIPEGATLEVEALLHNKDIGFVREGQAAEVKVETFNFTKYGLIGATIAHISDDAIQDQNLGWVFKTRLALQQDRIEVAGKMVRLSPGMAVTAEVITGKRRLIEYFLSPLLRYTGESVRER